MVIWTPQNVIHFDRKFLKDVEMIHALFDPHREQGGAYFLLYPAFLAGKGPRDRSSLLEIILKYKGGDDQNDVSVQALVGT
jgi:hypothetical protein